MVTVAELLADLTNLKTIDSVAGLSLVRSDTNDATQTAEDSDFARATELLVLRSEQLEHELLNEKRQAVDVALCRNEPPKARTPTPTHAAVSGGHRMAGSWAG